MTLWQLRYFSLPVFLSLNPFNFSLPVIFLLHCFDLGDASLISFSDVFQIPIVVLNCLLSHPFLSLFCLFADVLELIFKLLGLILDRFLMGFIHFLKFFFGCQLLQTSFKVSLNLDQLSDEKMCSAIWNIHLRINRQTKFDLLDPILKLRHELGLDGESFLKFRYFFRDSTF